MLTLNCFSIADSFYKLEIVFTIDAPAFDMYRPANDRGTANNREFKQITPAGATTAAVTEKVWGEYVSVVCQILSLASKAKYKDERNVG